MTRNAMGGKVLFEDALKARLDLIQPRKEQVLSIHDNNRLHLVDGIAKLVSTLHARGKAVFLVSGGFRLMIEV